MFEDTRATLRSFVLARFPAARARSLSYDEPLLDSGAVDSLGILVIAEYLTKEFGIELCDDDLNPETFHSISSLASFVISNRVPR